MVAPITAGVTTSAPALGGSSALGWAGMGLEAASGIYGAFASAEAARDQWAHQKKMMQKAYQWRVEDLKKAGLNPMLAFQQGVSIPTAGQMQRDSPLKGIASSALAVQASKRQMENLDASTEALLSQGMANRSSARKADAEANVIEQFGESRAGAEVSNLEATGREIAARIGSVLKGTELTEQSIRFNAELQPLKVAYQTYINDLTAAGIPEAAASAKFWKGLEDAGPFGKAAEWVVPLLRKLFGH